MKALNKQAQAIISDIRLKRGSGDVYAPIIRWDEFEVITGALENAEKRIEEGICRANREHHRGFMMACNHLKEHANIHYADAAEMEIAALRQRIAELEARSIGEHDLFLRAKALMYQSGGAPVEKSLNPVDAWLFDAEQATTKAPVLPPLNDDLVSILGRPNFMCSQFAEFLRMDGMEIRRKSEHEQAAVIHWFMNLYLQHGAGWGNVARAEPERINRAAGIGVKGD